VVAAVVNVDLRRIVDLVDQVDVVDRVIVVDLVIAVAPFEPPGRLLYHPVGPFHPIDPKKQSYQPYT
jgi:hypothetical protein